MDNYFYIIVSIFISAGLWLKFLYKHDSIEPEPLGLVIKIGFIGGFVSTLIAGTFNEIVSDLLEIDMNVGVMSTDKAIVFASFVGFNEELMKAIMVYLLVRNLDELDEPIDAIIYSTAVGLGFAFIENFSYSLQYGIGNLVVRSFTAMPLHIGLAALWGAKIAEAKFVTKKGIFIEMIPAIFLASVIHAVYDFILFISIEPIISILISLATGFILIRYTKNKMIELLNKSPFLKSGLCTVCGTISNPKVHKYCVGCNELLSQKTSEIRISNF